MLDIHPRRGPYVVAFRRTEVAGDGEMQAGVGDGGAAVLQGAPAQQQAVAGQGQAVAAPQGQNDLAVDPTLLQINSWMHHLNRNDRMILQRSLYIAAYDYVFDRLQ